MIGPVVNEFKVLQVLKKSDEVHDLPAGPFGFFQSETPERWKEAAGAPLNPWQEARDVQVVYPGLVDIY